MNLTRGFLFVCLSGVAFALLGAGIGQQIGVRVPEYYRTLLSVPDEANMPLLGTALGFVQGLLTGLGVGLVLALTVTWYEVQKLKYTSIENINPSTH